MDQAATADISRYSQKLAILLLLAGSPLVVARPPEPAARPTGIVEQPCPSPPSSTDKSAEATREWRERLLDPNAAHETEPADSGPSSSAHAADIARAEEDRLHNDWASLCRYRAENATLHRPVPQRVVFMGDSITEFWKLAHPEFFTDNFVDRGISGQTTAQMLVRFRQDVIALKPAVVHILAGTNDIAGNGGPTTLEAIRNNIASMVDLALINDIRVVLASVPPAGAFPWRPSVLEPAEHIVELNEWLRRFARERNLIYVDYHEPLADERDAMKQTFSNDGVHPNRDGYSAMEPLARRAIDQALAASTAASPKPTIPAAPRPAERRRQPKPAAQ